jgi:hypothetical protein
LNRTSTVIIAGSVGIRQITEVFSISTHT